MSRAAVATLAILVGLAIGGSVGWFAGRFVTVLKVADEQYDRDTALAWPVLSGDPAFRHLGPLNYPVGGFCLAGSVPTEADYDRLRAEMIRLFGEPRVDHILNDVRVEEPNPKQGGGPPEMH
jgi:hypothetical protein